MILLHAKTIPVKIDVCLCVCSFVCSIVTPAVASDRDLRLFHSAEYVECLRHLSQLDDSEKSVDKMEEFGLGEQCNFYLNTM